MEEKAFADEELAKSSRIFKSATPKQSLDWYVKWVASVFVLAAMSIRGIEGYGTIDLMLSSTGILLWLWVSILWHDRALIILNGVGFLFLIRNLIEQIA